MNFNIFSSLNCLCYYSNWRCLSLRHLFSCLWNAINVIIHLLHSLEIMILRMSLLLNLQVAYKPKPCFQRHFLSIILHASQNEIEDFSVVWVLHTTDCPTVTMQMSYWQNAHLPCPCCTRVDVLFCTTIQAKINESRLKAHDHALCTALLFLAPNGCVPSPVLIISLTTKAWHKQGSNYQATSFLLQVLF